MQLIPTRSSFLPRGAGSKTKKGIYTVVLLVVGEKLWSTHYLFHKHNNLVYYHNITVQRTVMALSLILSMYSVQCTVHYRGTIYTSIIILTILL